MVTAYLRVEQPYQLVVAEEELPPLAPGQARLAARRSLISTGSELRRYRRYEGYDVFSYPVTDLGYSMVGQVIDPGTTQATVGDHYIAIQRHATVVDSPIAVDGVRTAVRLPSGLSAEEATFAPLVRSTMNWIRNGAIGMTDTVVVVGQGLVGALLLQAAKLFHPRRLIATDACARRLAIARACGADEAIDAQEDPVAAVRAATGGRGAEVVIETVGGAAVESFAQALRMVRPGGRLLAVGMHTAPIPVPVHTLHNITVIGSQVGYDYGALHFERSVDLLAEGAFQIAPLITHRFPYQRAAAAYELLDKRPQEALGVILEW